MSWVAVGMLSEVLPVKLLARMYTEVYNRVRELQRAGIQVTDVIRRTIREQTQRILIEKWTELLEDPNLSGQRTVRAVKPYLIQWLNRTRGGMTYRMTQVFTGHGCFGEYLIE